VGVLSETHHACHGPAPAVAEVDPLKLRVHGHVHGLGHVLLGQPSASKQICKLLEIFQEFTIYLQKVNNRTENFWTGVYNSRYEIKV
jgi:hypothetical protein